MSGEEEIEISNDPIGEDNRGRKLNLFVARKNNQVVGTAVTSSSTQALDIENIQANPDQRKNGVGSRLIDTLTSFAKEQGAKEITGYFNPDPAAGEAGVKRFYKNKGFKIDSNNKLHKDLNSD